LTARRSWPRANCRDHVKDSKDLDAVPDHVSVPRLPPPKHAGPIDDESGSVGHVPIFVEHAIGSNGSAVHVTQERKRELASLRKCLVAKGRVATDREQLRASLMNPVGDLAQVIELRRSDAAPVVTVESQDDIRTTIEFFQRDHAAERRRKRKIRSGLTPSKRRHRASPRPP